MALAYCAANFHLDLELKAVYEQTIVFLSKSPKYRLRVDQLTMW